MSFSNSPLATYTKLSPNHSGKRTHVIDRITPHCVVGQLRIENLATCFQDTSVKASCNYGIGLDGTIGLIVEEKNRSWCSSSGSNDQRAVTIECASGAKFPYEFYTVVFDTLVKLCVDICHRNGKTKLLWLGDKDTTLAYEPMADEMVLTCHRWFAPKECPGDWLIEREAELAMRVNEELKKLKPVEEDHLHGTQATVLAKLDNNQVVAKMGPLFTADQKETGILASVSMAQFILESGFGSSELAQGANNLFGMKTSLSGNTWAGSTWDGKSVYGKETLEEVNGKYVTIVADFRRYCCIEDGIADHSAYLLGAKKNATQLRYEGLKGCADYRKALQILKDGGYATDSAYVDKLCRVVEQWNLTKFDLQAQEPQTNLYRVRKTWDDAKSQIGAFGILENAKNVADSNPGYSVFDYQGNKIYPEESASYIEYTVVKGDSLWLIAEKFLQSGARYNEIKVYNGLTTNTINIGQILRIPVSVTSQKPAEETKWVPKKGDVVKIEAGATWYAGQKISSWVINKTWYIASISGDRAVIGKSTDGLNNVQSPINVKFLKKA